MGKEPLWCENCGTPHEGVCPIAPPLRVPLPPVRDKPIQSQARLSLPQYLDLRQVDVEANGKPVLGVFSSKIVQQRTQFGPFIAPRAPISKSNENEVHNPDKFVYKIFDKDGQEQAKLDLRDENCCSWMIFIRPARTADEQNLVVYQFNDDLFFTSCKPIQPNCELKVYYASDYAKLMNVKTFECDGTDSLLSIPMSQDDSTSSFVSVTTYPSLEHKASTSFQYNDTNNNEAPSSSEPWKCSSCNKVFATFNQLESHLCESRKAKRGRKPKLKEGEEMSKEIEGPSGSDKGQAGKTKGKGARGRGKKDSKNFACGQCDKVFMTAEKMKTHTYLHTGERPFTCSESDCGKAFISKYKLLRHMATHSPNKMHSCTFCDKKFHRKDHLKNHLHTHDPNKVLFRCTECGKVYNTKPGYKKHIAMHAAASGELVCKICERECENTEALLQHIKSHSGKSSVTKEKKHQCEHCDRKFYTRKDVRRHMVVHTGRKDFLCQTCGQRFGRKDHLVRHTRKSHEGSDPQIRVRLGEHLQAMAVASMPNMVTSQGMTFQEPFHSMHDSQQLLHPQIPSTSIQQEPPYPMSPPVRNRLMELLKIPPVPPSRFNNNYHPQIKVEPVMESMESMGSCKMGVDPMTPTSVDVGHLLGFLPVNSTHMQPQHHHHHHHQGIPPPTPTSPHMMVPTTSHASLPQSTQNAPQAHLPHNVIQAHSVEHIGMPQVTAVDLHVNQMQMSSHQVSQQGLDPMHVGFLGNQALPRFHQAFQ
ncbi:uncharacterized protein [Apostichopus japonicus]